MINRASLRLSAGLLILGEIVSLASGAFHPAHEAANDHAAVFAEYAHSHNWILVHMGQFAGVALIVAGLVALFFALDVRGHAQAWVARFGAISAVVTLGLYGVLQAVDGVGLKQAVDAWAKAPEAGKAAAFASAETMRWLEWGVRSFQQSTQGLALILFGVVLVSVTRLPRAIGYLAGLAGLGLVVQGVVIGYEGFSTSTHTPGLLALVLGLVWVVWLGVVAWRMDEPTAQPERAKPAAGRSLQTAGAAR